MMKTLRTLLLIVLLSLGASQLSEAQQRTVLTQYMFNHLVINPAYAGLDGQLSATLLYRDQWLNFEGAPTSTIFTAHSGFKGKNVGLGVMVSQEQIGVHNDVGVYFSYSFSISTRLGRLAMGLQGGFNNLESDYTLLNLRADSDPVFANNLRSFRPNFGTGLYFWNKRTRISFSIPYIINNQLGNDNETLSRAREARNYYLYGARIFPLSKDIKIQPSVLLRAQEGQPMGIDVNANVILKDLISMGVMYRSGDAVSALVQFRIVDNLYFGYAYDITVSDVSAFSRGTHEMMLNYRLKIPSLHEGLACPAYF